MAHQFVRARNEDQAREILEAAYSMANNITSDDREWVHVFDKAVDLLAAGTMLVEQPQTVSLPPAMGMIGKRH